MQRFDLKRWLVTAAAVLWMACIGGGVSQSAQPETSVEGGTSSVCGRDPVLDVTITVSRGSGGSDYDIDVDPDPAMLCADGEPSAVRWTLDDQTGAVDKWDVLPNASKACQSGGRNDVFSLETSKLGDNWFGGRGASAEAGECWAYDVVLAIGAETVTKDPEVDWGT